MKSVKLKLGREREESVRRKIRTETNNQVWDFAFWQLENKVVRQATHTLYPVFAVWNNLRKNKRKND